MKLPDQFVEHTIANLPPGVTAWTVPWAIWVGADGTMWINTRYTVHEEPGGTVQMSVQRHGREGYAVTFPETERFHRADRPPHMGADLSQYAPIEAMSTFKGSRR